ncbi:hypothetical protein Ptc2401_02171 [Prosthecochloris sp. CIB 2401]|nr:hypothetical protein Ptc2401_02171 [Prosthecochloris sp. CIB 2401]
MLATFRSVFHSEFRERTIGFLDYPVTAVAVRHAVFRLACVDTRRAAYADPGVDNHSVIFLLSHVLRLLDKSHKVVLKTYGANGCIDFRFGDQFVM